MKLRLSALVAGAMLATILTVAGPIAVVLACSCMQLQPGQALEMADVAFVGVVAGMGDPNAGKPQISSGDPVLYTFAVEEALKQAGGSSTMQISSARDGASCGQIFAMGQRWRLHAYREGATLSTGICSGNELLAEGVSIPEHPGTDPQSPPTAVLVALAASLLVAGISTWAFTRRERGTSA